MLGREYLYAILKENNIELLLEIEKKYLTTEEIKIYDYIFNYYNEEKNCPPLSLVLKMFSDECGGGTTKFWRTEYLKRKISIIYNESILKINNDISEGNIEEVKSKLLSLFSKIDGIQTKQGSIKTIEECFTQIIKSFPERRLRDGILGIETGWISLSHMIRGFIEGNIYVFCARKKVGKTQSLAYMSNYIYGQGHDVLFVSMEMTQVEYFNRLLSLNKKINLNCIVTGKISTVVEKNLNTEMSYPKNKYVFKEGFFNTSISELEHSIITQNPKIVFVDGAYLLRPSYSHRGMQGWERVTEVIKELKILAGKYNIPLVVSYQLNKEGEVHLSDAIPQIATAVIGIYEDTENTRKIEILDNRHGARGVLKIHWDYNYMNFSEIESMSEEIIDD